MSGFTPGPWVASDRTDSHEIYAAVYPGRPICHASSYWQGEGPRRDERKANARLIAAAPELYEALKTALLLMELQWGKDATEASAIGEARAALAKARGEQVPA